jgi:hypothetical protein
MQEDTLQVLRAYLQKEHTKEKRIDLPNQWKLYTMCNVPQQDTTNTTDCGVFVCMYCNFILNDCKLDFKQDNITNSDWRDRMILSILLVKPTNDKEKNNNDKVTLLRAIKMKRNNKQKNIARASTWSMNLTMNKDCKVNKDDKMDYNDDCNGGLDCKKEKLSNNSHFISLQIDGQSPNLFSSNYITEAKKGHSITSPKQIMIQSHHQ